MKIIRPNISASLSVYAHTLIQDEQGRQVASVSKFNNEDLSNVKLFANAVNAHDTMVKLYEKLEYHLGVVINHEDRRVIKEQLAGLRSALEDGGYTFKD